MIDELIERVEKGEGAVSPDREPGFWSEFTEPKSQIARAIQYPISDAGWSGRVINTYLRDTSPRALRAHKEQHDERD